MLHPTYDYVNMYQLRVLGGAEEDGLGGRVDLDDVGLTPIGGFVGDLPAGDVVFGDK